VYNSLLVHNNLSQILCCVVGGWDKSVRFTVMSRGDLTYLAGLLQFVMAHSSPDMVIMCGRALSLAGLLQFVMAHSSPDMVIMCGRALSLAGLLQFVMAMGDSSSSDMVLMCGRAL
jgi:mitochondrial fission protein ELM1